MGAKISLLSALIGSVCLVAACGFGIDLNGLAGDAGTDGGGTDAGGDVITITPVAGLSIAAGNSATCVVRQDGTVACWGDGGHLGNGTSVDSSMPVLVQGLSDATQVCVGSDHACAVRKTGQVVCWGGNGYGQLGDGSTSRSNTPVPAAGVTSAVAVSCEYATTCALNQDGTVACWGYDANGQVGNGSTADTVAVAVPVAGVTDVVSVAAGYSHACVATKSGAVYCWGGGGYGENGDPNKNDSLVPELVSGIGNVTAVGAGAYYTCALTTTGQVSCWGVSWDGRLGNPNASTTNVPTDTGLSNVTGLSVGHSHACVVKGDGTAACWGDNWLGACGVGAHGGSIQTPVPVTGVSNASAIASGFDHSCTLLADGKVSCWGSNTSGALGEGTLVLSTQPVAVPGETSAADIACGDDFTCDARTDGTVACWGANWNLELGQQSPALTATPSVVPTLSGIQRVYAGPDSQTGCAIGGSNAVTCWGDDQYGQLGFDNGGDSAVTTPFPVAGTSVVTGAHHVCVLATDGTVQCAGYDNDGQLGDGNTSGQTATPVTVTGVATATLLGGGVSQNCALAAGGLLCWGDDDSGQLGDGNTTNLGTPTVATNIAFTPSYIASGNDFFCDIDPNGDVYCIGRGDSGQMGTGSLSSSSTPVKVLALGQAATQVAAGDSFACARLADGSAACWGDDGIGQLGNGQIADYAIASPVKNLPDAVKVCAGSYHACAVRSGGQVVCWGSNWAGQLGDGTAMIVDTPTPVQSF